MRAARVRRAAAGPSSYSTVWALRRASRCWTSSPPTGRSAPQGHPGDGEGTCAHVSLGRMDRFLVPAAASIVVRLLLRGAAIFGITLMQHHDPKAAVQAVDPASAVLKRVEYGDQG